MKVRLNLATNALQTHRKFLALSSLIGVLAGIFFVVLGWHVYSVRKAEENLRAQEQEIRREMVGLQRQRQELEQFFTRPENAKLHDRSAFLNTLIDAQSLNWTQMFMDLEKILPPGVRLTGIEPKREKGRVQVKFHVSAVSDEAKLKFIRALEDSTVFTDIQESVESSADPATAGPDRLLIELTAVYVRA